MQKSTLMDESVEIKDPTTDVLEEGWLHKVMVLLNIPSQWPMWKIVIAGLILALFSSAAWWFNRFSPRLAVTVYAVQIGFMVVDATMLMLLPRQKLSFGPWQPQLAALTIPRILASFILAFVTLLLSNRTGFLIMMAVQMVATLAFYKGAFIEPFQLGLTELLVFTDRLPVGLPPIRIMHITDLHIERWTKREDDVLRIVEEMSPDLIVISGDYVNLSYNRDLETHQLVFELLSQLSAPHGVYATLGSPPVDLRETVVPIFDRLDIPLLRHEWQHIDFGDGRELILLGMDCTHHIPTDEARLARLLSQAPNHIPQLLLFHSPELMPQAAAQGIDLYLCGHTHGGQVRVPFIGPLLTSSQLGRQYVMGHYRRGRTHLYVSRGIGLEGLSAPRVRFMAPPEMTLVMLMPGGTPEESLV